MELTLLDGIKARCIRAEEQIANLSREVGIFANSKSHRITKEKDPDGREHRRRVHFDPKPDTIRWAILFGELIHNYRSVLDNLAYALVVANRHTPTKNTAFPIFRDGTRFKKAAGQMTAGMHRDAVAKIKRMQPFSTGGDAPESNLFSVLHELNIVDKHHLVIPVILAHSESYLWLQEGYDGDFANIVEDGGVLITIKPDAAVDEVQVKADAIFDIGVEIGDARRYTFVQLLPVLVQEMNWIVSEFEIELADARL